MDLADELLAAVSAADSAMTPTSATAVMSALQKVVRTRAATGELDQAADHGSRALWELMAFEFAPGDRNSNKSNGHYYGPMVVWRNDDGTWFERPSPERITPDVVAYWRARARAARHPVLSARYADLAWEFGRSHASARDVADAHLAIEATSTAAESGLFDAPLEGILALTRGVDLAYTVNHHREQTARQIVRFEDVVAQDGMLGLWGFSFDALLSRRKRGSVDAELEAEIIQSLDGRLTRTTAAGATLHPWAAMAAARRLCEWHARHPDQVKRIADCLTSGFHLAARESSEPQAAGMLHDLYEFLLEHGLKADAQKLSVELQKADRKAITTLSRHEFRTELSKEKVDEMMAGLEAPTLPEQMANVATAFLLRRETTEEMVTSMRRDAPLVSMLRHVVMDADGRPVIEIDPRNPNGDHWVQHNASQMLAWQGVLLRIALDRLLREGKLPTADMIQELALSPAFPPATIPFLGAGLSAWRDGRPVEALHVLVPVIERSIRAIAFAIGVPTYAQGRDGRFDFRGLGELLRDSTMEQGLSKEVAWYLRLVLTEQAGWNLRNNVAHGILPVEQCEMSRVDRLVHVLLVLGLLRLRDDPDVERPA